MTEQVLLDVRNLRTEFKTGRKQSVTAVNGVSFQVRSGEIVGLVGESGCGKSVTSLSIMQLFRNTNGRVTDGQVLLKGKDLLKCSEKEMRAIRGKEISMIFQEPMSSLNPSMRIDAQLIEAIRLHTDLDKKAAREHALDMLGRVGIANPAMVLRSFPHQLSGGMSQRVMIAMAMCCDPTVLIADEPTTALDVTIQAQIMDLLVELKEKINTAIILITHDLGVVAGVADRVAVMYAGKVVETGTVQDIFYRNSHPYTQALLKSLPSPETTKDETLTAIPGTPPDLLNPPVGCAFAARCKHCMQICLEEQPPEFQVSEGHCASCWLLHPDCPPAQERGEKDEQ